MEMKKYKPSKVLRAGDFHSLYLVKLMPLMQGKHAMTYALYGQTTRTDALIWWNEIPSDIKLSQNVDILKKNRLKSYLYDQS